MQGGSPNSSETDESDVDLRSVHLGVVVAVVEKEGREGERGRGGRRMLGVEGRLREKGPAETPLEFTSAFFFLPSCLLVTPSFLLQLVDWSVMTRLNT